MILTNFSIRHFMAVLVLCVGIVMLGMSAYLSLPRESFPDVSFPVIIVTTVLDGANPTEVEESVTIPLETELDGIEGLKEMRSVSSESISMVSLEFHPEIDTEAALSRVRDRIDQAKPNLAPDAEQPLAKEFSLTSVPVIIYHMVGRGAISLSELNDLADQLEEEIKGVNGVLDVDVFGGREQQIIIEVNPDRLHFYNLNLMHVQNVLRGTNRNVSAGTVATRTNRVVVRVPGEFRDPGDILNLVISIADDGSNIYVRDVATARYDYEDELSRARLYDFSGHAGYVEPAKSVSLHIKKRAGANMLALSADIEALIAGKALPPDVLAIKGFDMSKDVREMVGDLENGIATSLVLVLLVIFIGLGGRNALLVAASVPFSMLLSLLILQWMGQTLNMMVLFSLILALGMLVDNAIVIIENIYRYYSMGIPRVEAAMRGTAEVAWPVITSTATTVGAFAPLLFWPGLMGEFMSFLPRTVIVVLVSSLFVALVINPTLAALFMHVKAKDRTSVDPESQRPHYWLVLRYETVLRYLLRHPLWTMVTAVLMLVLTLASYGLFGAGVEFFPPIDPDQVTASIKPVEGTSLEESDRLAQVMEARLFGAPGSGYSEPVPNLKYASVVVGIEDGIGGGLGNENVGPVRVQVEFIDREFRRQRTTATVTQMRQRLEGLDQHGNRIMPPLYGAEFDIIQPQGGPPTGAPVSIDIFGNDLNEMTRVAMQLKRIMASVPGTVKPTDDAVTAQPTLEWHVDRSRAGAFGLYQPAINSVLQIAIGGLRTGSVGHGDDEKDVFLRLSEVYRLDSSRLYNISIPSDAGAAVPLASVATSSLVPGPVAIKHFNRRRVLNVSSEIQPGLRDDAGVREMFQTQARQYPFPPGITYRFGGAAEEQEKAQAFLLQAFMIAVFTIVMVMVLQFNSLIMSGIVMVSVVLSLMGVFIGLLILQAPFGIIMTGIGVISLAGVVVNNAIVLLDACLQFERQGQHYRDAVISAAMTRFRPVLLTAITTILGLLPMALKLNFDFRALAFQYDTSSAQWWQGMATAVIFGLLIATILTLGVVPTLYQLYRDLREWFARNFGQALAANGNHPAAGPCRGHHH